MESSQDMYVFLIINSFSTQNFAVQLHAMFTQSATSVNSTRWSQSTGCVDLPRVKTSVGQHSFAFHGPTVWNSLPSAQLRLPRTDSVEQSAVSAASPSTDPHCGTVCRQHSFAFHGPTLWNSLPSALHDSSLSLNTSQRRLKTDLFGQSWMPSATLWRFSVILAPDINIMTYLLTYF